MAIRLVAIDLDGTLFGQGNTPSTENIKAIGECTELGIRVCVCTGRSLVQVAEPFASGAALDDICVLTNGASIMNRKTGEYVLERRIDPAVVEPMLRLLVEDCQSVPERTLSVTGMYQTHAYRPLANRRMIEQWETASNTYLAVHNTLERFIAACVPDVQRIDYSVPYADGQRVLNLLSPIVELDRTSGDPKRLELVPKGISKGDGLSRLADYYAVPRECVMAVGDGINDDSMIRWAGLGVAMGNAVESLKMMADAVTDTCENDGLAKAIRAYALKG